MLGARGQVAPPAWSGARGNTAAPSPHSCERERRPRAAHASAETQGVTRPGRFSVPGAFVSCLASLIAQEARHVLEATLRRGFTSVRDAGGADWGLASAVDRGLLAGGREGRRFFVNRLD